MTSHQHATDRTKAAASIPWALVTLAEFVLAHELSPLDVSVSSRRDVAVIYVDAREADAWVEAFDRPPTITTRDVDRQGTHHHAVGTLAGVAVSVRWYVIAHRVVEVERLRLVHHADAFHVPCEGDDEAPGHVTLCLDDDATGPHDGTVERACPHGMNLCDRCRLACPECRDDHRNSWSG